MVEGGSVGWHGCRERAVMGSCVALPSWFFLYASIRSVVAASSAEILLRSFRRGYVWASFTFGVLHALVEAGAEAFSLWLRGRLQICLRGFCRMVSTFFARNL